MDTSANIITTMGIISDGVYDNKYFTDDAVNTGLKIEGTTYKVLDHTPASNQGFNALLLQEEGTNNYVIAFRGTQEKFDIVDDVIIGLNNYSLEFQQAKAWVDKVLTTEYNEERIPKENLTSELLGDVLQIWGADRGADAHRIPNLNEAIQHYNEVLSHFNNTTYKTLTDVCPETVLLKGFLERVCVEDSDVFQAVIASGHFENVLRAFENMYVNPDERTKTYIKTEGNTAYPVTITIDDASIETYAETLGEYIENIVLPQGNKILIDSIENIGFNSFKNNIENSPQALSTLLSMNVFVMKSEYGYASTALDNISEHNYSTAMIDERLKMLEARAGLSDATAYTYGGECQILITNNLENFNKRDVAVSILQEVA